MWDLTNISKRTSFFWTWCSGCKILDMRSSKLEQSSSFSKVSTWSYKKINLITFEGRDQKVFGEREKQLAERKTSQNTNTNLHEMKWKFRARGWKCLWELLAGPTICFQQQFHCQELNKVTWSCCRVGVTCVTHLIDVQGKKSCISVCAKLIWTRGWVGGWRREFPDHIRSPVIEMSPSSQGKQWKIPGL